MTSYNIILTGIATLLAIYCLYLRRTIARLKSDMQPVSEHRLMVSNNNIMDVIKKTADHMRPQMERHQIQFSVKCTPDSMMGWIDTYVVSQIVTGILTASAKNTERTGSIQLSVTTSKFYDFININLTDSGITAPPSETDDTLRLIHLHHGTLTTDDHFPVADNCCRHRRAFGRNKTGNTQRRPRVLTASHSLHQRAHDGY